MPDSSEEKSGSVATPRERVGGRSAQDESSVPPTSNQSSARQMDGADAARSSEASAPRVTTTPPAADQPDQPVGHKPSRKTYTGAASQPGDTRGEASAAKLTGAVEATRRRAASVVKESIAPRVERVRDRSIVMLEEPPDDSGLRFVIIAAVLFAFFIFLLVLHTVIK